MLGSWNSFYVMMGSSAAALTGLVFIVITLIRDQNRGETDAGIPAFTTPTVVHFSCALLTSAVMSVPFASLAPVAVILGLAGAGGLIYMMFVTRRHTLLQNYRPDAEDWTWYVVLPFVAYATLLASTVAMPSFASGALYATAAAVMFLIFIGIHNAWDVVTFLATGKVDELPDDPPSGAAKKSD
jgi:hypothetical protein